MTQSTRNTSQNYKDNRIYKGANINSVGNGFESETLFKDFEKNRKSPHSFANRYLNTNSTMSMDEVPTRENSSREVFTLHELTKNKENKENSSKMLNFKEFYELKKMGLEAPKQQLRSKSSFNQRDPYLNALRPSNKPNLFDYQNQAYNINEFLPSNNGKPIATSSSYINILDTQTQVPNIFKNNQQNFYQAPFPQYPSPLRQSSIPQTIFSHPPPPFFQQPHPLQQFPPQSHPHLSTHSNHSHSSSSLSQPSFQAHNQCSCQCQQSQYNMGSQAILTQRSSVCSCQYSQSSASHSKNASPLQFHSKSQARVINQKSPTPFKRQGSNIQIGQNMESYNFQNQRNIFNENSNNKQTNQKSEQKSMERNNGGTMNGYNTDDLIRDSSQESDIDMTQISHALREVQKNVNLDFQQALQNNDLQNLNRMQKEELALRILMQNNQGLNNQQFVPQDNGQKLDDSQIKTIKYASQMSHHVKPFLPSEKPGLTLDQLSINEDKYNSNPSTFPIQTPVSLQNMNIDNPQQYILHPPVDQMMNQNSRNANTIYIPQGQSVLSQQMQNTFQQQYFSPCFNQSEESKNQIQQQLLNQYLQMNHNNPSANSLKQQYNSVPAQHSSQNQQITPHSNFQVYQTTNPGNDNSMQTSSLSNPNQNDQSTTMILELSNTFNNKSNTQSKNSKNTGKKLKKQKSKHLINKKIYNEDILSNSDESSSGDQSEQDSERASFNIQTKQKSNASKDRQSVSNLKNKSKISAEHSNNTMIKVLREMSIQTSQTFTMGDFEGGCSFLDKSELQIQVEKNKNEVGCQYEVNKQGQQRETQLELSQLGQNQNQFEDQFDEQSYMRDQPNSVKQANNKGQHISLPPSQKRIPSLPRIIPASALQNKSLGGCSIPTSKNSTIRTPHNLHFQSHQPHELDDYYLQLDDESVQQHNQSIIGHSSAATSGRQLNNGGHTLSIGNTNHQLINNTNSIQSPFNNNQNHFDHFKSQCSEVIIRGSGDTDISNRIQRFNNQRQNSSNHIQNQSQNHSHQVSGSQSIAHVGQGGQTYLSQHQRSQFTSLESSNASPNKQQLYNQNLHKKLQIINQQRISQSEQILREESCGQGAGTLRTSDQENTDHHLHTGDTFMKYQKEFQSQNNYMNMLQTDEEDFQSEQRFHDLQSQTEEDSYRQSSKQIDQLENNRNIQLAKFYQQNTQSDQQTDTQPPDEEEFNYTIRLTEMKGTGQEQQKKKSSLPPIYNQKLSTNPTQQSIPGLNNTSSTAGFPMLYGYNPSQQTGRKSPSIHSSFQSQKISHAPSQTSFQTSARSALIKQKNSKLSFMEKVTLIQKHVREFLLKKKHQVQLQNQFFGDSTIHKPQEESLSNISAQLLNSLKHHLNTSSNIKSKEIKPSEQSYRKNILESLNLTTGNTFIRETKHFTQGGTQPIMRGEKSQILGTSTAGLVLYSESTYDNRPLGRHQNDLYFGGRNFQANQQQLESQQTMTKQYMNAVDFDGQLNSNLQNSQQSPNSSSLLNLTEESNSALFKLTPIASSQNITQKSHFLHLNTNQLSQLNQNIERTTESNNLNYSYSEIDSEFAGSGIPRDCTVSPMSIKTTQSKGKSKSKIGHSVMSRAHPSKHFVSRGDSIQTEQNSIHKQAMANSSLNYSDMGDQQSKYSHKLTQLDTEGGNGVNYFGISSPVSTNPQITASTKTNATPTQYNQPKQIFVMSKQEHLLNILKSDEFSDSDMLNISQMGGNEMKRGKQEMIYVREEEDENSENKKSRVEEFAWKDLKAVEEGELKGVIMEMVRRQAIMCQSV